MNTRLSENPPHVFSARHGVRMTGTEWPFRDPRPPRPGITSLNLALLGFLLSVECTRVGVYGGVWSALLDRTQDTHSFTVGTGRWHHRASHTLCHLRGKSGAVFAESHIRQFQLGHYHFRLVWSCCLMKPNKNRIKFKDDSLSDILGHLSWKNSTF